LFLALVAIQSLYQKVSPRLHDQTRTNHRWTITALSERVLQVRVPPKVYPIGTTMGPLAYRTTCSSANCSIYIELGAAVALPENDVRPYLQTLDSDLPVRAWPRQRRVWNWAALNN
jgi:hypothetical protein